MSGVITLTVDADEKMEEIHPSTLQVVMNAINEEGLLVKQASELSAKDEDIKEDEYFLQVEEQGADLGDPNTQFIALAGECGENEVNQYVALQVDEPDEIILTEKNVIIWNKLCRICANQSDKFIPIFSDEGLEHEIQNKIETHLPLKIAPDDTLPLQLCYNCAATLIAWHDMSKGCLAAQERLMEFQNQLNAKEQYEDSNVEADNTDIPVETENFQNEDIQNEEVTETEETNNEEIAESATEENEESSLRATAQQQQQQQQQPSQEHHQQQQQQQEELEVNILDNAALDPTAKEHPHQYKYMCGICDEVYEHEYVLMQHLKTDHDQATDYNAKNPVRYECNVCGKAYIRKLNLIIHLKWHSRKLEGEDGIVEKSKIFVNQTLLFKCESCLHVISNRRAFLRHIRMHADERPVICHLCGKSYRIEDDLKRHIDDVHEKIKRFPCDLCGNSFAAKATRDAHRRIHTGEKPFPCKICNKNFRSINLLGIHKRIHTDYRPHKCSFCEKAFRDKQKLTVHMSIHTGVKPYECEVCGKNFAAKSELGRHRTVHSNVRPFLCSECGLNFRLCRYLRTHIKQYHAEIADIMLKSLERN